jgi:AraC-like DNA-binding protein
MHNDNEGPTMPFTADGADGETLRSATEGMRTIESPRRERADESTDLLANGGLLSQLSTRLRFAEAFLVSTMPRGGLQLVQAQGSASAPARAYARLADANDRLTYRALETQGVVTRANCWTNAEAPQNPFVREVLIPAGLNDALAAPMRAPIIAGYPGALHVYRAADDQPFNSADAQTLAQFAAHFDRAAAEQRLRRGYFESPDALPTRIFVLDGHGKPRIGAEVWEKLDPTVRNQLAEAFRHRLAASNGNGADAAAAETGSAGAEASAFTDRVGVSNAHGQRLLFRLVLHRSIEALGGGPFAFICQQLDWSDWETLRAGDVSADAELARLIPSAKFMQKEFRRGPTLAAIAKTVHLSPFHFHRRFTELLGITPKHFMLDSQIHEAKAALLAGDVPLAEIAARCGFSHQSHFTSRFKQATGLTPTRWRRMAQAPTDQMAAQ